MRKGWIWLVMFVACAALAYWFFRTDQTGTVATKETHEKIQVQPPSDVDKPSEKDSLETSSGPLGDGGSPPQNPGNGSQFQPNPPPPGGAYGNRPSLEQQFPNNPPPANPDFAPEQSPDNYQPPAYEPQPIPYQDDSPMDQPPVDSYPPPGEYIPPNYEPPPAEQYVPPDSNPDGDY